MKRIQLSQDQWALVDDEMFDYLNAFKWCVQKTKKRFYAKRTLVVDGKPRCIYLHHVVIGRPINGYEIDHLNGDSLDNREANLRVCSVRENQLNQYRHRAGWLPGAYYQKYCRNKKWQSKITIGKKDVSLGYFASREEANQAYVKKCGLLRVKQ